MKAETKPIEVVETKSVDVKVETTPVEVKDVKVETNPVVVEEVKSIQIVETPKVIAELKAADEPPKPVDPAVVQKLETNPEPPTIVPSNHQVADVPVAVPVIKISKNDEDGKDVMVGGAAGTPNVMIDTEPSVHFTPYDTVFDETSQGISHIRYSPKDGNDDGYDHPPRLTFGSSANAIETNDAEDLEPVAAVAAAAPAAEVDIDAPLGSTGDFEELS